MHHLHPPRGYRRTAVAALSSIVAIGVTFLVTPGAGAESSIPPGRGSALAQTNKIDPRAGQLSLGFTFGISLAGHQNTVAQASSQAIDLGQIGATMASQGCDGGDPTLPADQQPTAARVDSRDEHPTVDEDEDKVPAGLYHKHAEANDDPLGKAITTTAPMGIQGVLEIGQGTATAYSGVLDGKTREAKGVTDISGINLAGVVKMSGLHWEATYRSSDGGLVSGVFSIASASIAGQPVPTDDPAETIDQANEALKLLGLQLTAPVTHEDGGVLFVDPMGIAVIPSAQRDLVAGKVIKGIQPVRQALFDALLAQDCGNSTYVTIFDIALGSITGAGSFGMNLGGVSATSGEALDNPFALGGGPSQFPLTPTTQGSSPPTLGSAGTPAPSLSPSPSTTAPPSTTGGQEQATPVSVTKAAGKRAGALAGVGLAGLGFVVAMAEGDRRKMRRAQREIPELQE